MVYRSHRIKSRKPSRRRRKHRNHSQQRNSRRRRKSLVCVSKTKSRRRSRRRKSSRRSRKRSLVRVRRKSRRRGTRRKTPRRKSRRMRSRKTIQPTISLLTKETKLRFNFSSNTSTASPTRRDNLAAPLVIFGMDGCPGCDTAKNICKKKGIKFSYHLRKDNEETVKKVAPGYKYVPVIVNRFGKFVGGSDKLQEYTKNMPDIN